MTNDELRELDRQIAEARGWMQAPYALRAKGSNQLGWTSPDGAYGGHFDLPRFSTVPELSRVLLDEMAADGSWFIAIENLTPFQWCVTAYVRGESNSYEIAVEEDTVDIAICRSYLAWKEAQP